MIRSGLLVAVIGLIGQVASADGIHYEWIPADVTGYGQVDFERLVSSRLMKSVNDGGESLSALMANLGDIGDGTIYSLKIDGNSDAVMITPESRDHPKFPVPRAGREKQNPTKRQTNPIFSFITGSPFFLRIARRTP